MQVSFTLAMFWLPEQVFYRFLTATAFSLADAIVRLDSHTFVDNAAATFTLTASHAHTPEERETL